MKIRASLTGAPTPPLAQDRVSDLNTTMINGGVSVQCMLARRMRAFPALRPYQLFRHK